MLLLPPSSIPSTCLCHFQHQLLYEQMIESSQILYFFAASISNSAHMDTSSVMFNEVPTTCLESVHVKYVNIQIRYNICILSIHKHKQCMSSIIFITGFRVHSPIRMYYPIAIYIYVQIIVFHHLVHWLSSSRFTFNIHRSFMRDDLNYVSGIISNQSLLHSFSSQ